MTAEQRRKCMRRIRSKDTNPELVVRRYLWGRGYRYRKHVGALPGTPDIVLRRHGVVVFVHGCFWHGHEPHFRLPATNREFWEAKIKRNRERDERSKEQLRQLGWTVITVWECQLKPSQRRYTLLRLEQSINEAYLARHDSRYHYAAEPSAPYRLLPPQEKEGAEKGNPA